MWALWAGTQLQNAKSEKVDNLLTSCKVTCTLTIATLKRQKVKFYILFCSLQGTKVSHVILELQLLEMALWKDLKEKGVHVV